MRELYYFVLVLCVFHMRASVAHEVVADKHTHFSFASLVDAVNDDFLDVTKLFEALHYENCSTSRSQNESCLRCFSVEDYENSTGFKASTPLNATQFQHIAPIFVYFLLPNSGLAGAVCKTPPLPEKLFDALVANYSGEGAKGITEEALDEILERINQTSRHYLQRKECFSAHSIFEEIKDTSHEEEDHDDDHEGIEDHDDDHKSEHSNLDEDDFQKACASILFHLVEGYCIKDDHAHNETSKLPPKTFFVSNLFRGKQRITEASLEGLVKKLGIGEAADTTSHTEEEVHHGHNHRRRRREAKDPHKHEEHDDDHGRSHSYNTCFSLDDMLTIFGVDHAVGADQDQFKDLCPAFIQQFQSGVCTSSAETVTTPTVTRHVAKIWGYGFAAVTIISVLSMIGVATIPFIGKKFYKKVLALLVALAVGSLAGDGMLHLIPHAFGLHAHEHSESEEDSHDSSSEKQFLWKALVVLVAVYAFYLFETLMHLCLKTRVHSHNAHGHIDTERPEPTSRHMSFKNRERTCSKLEPHEGALPVEDEKLNSTGGAMVLTNMYTDIKDNDADHQHQTENDHDVKKKISTVAWMIIIGDTLHNISDGLAIGAAFSAGGNSGISGGISTSIAVFCHELPHELGDFAVLLTAGMSVKMALLANFLSACSCYVGLAIGIAIGQQTDVRLWIFAIAGGMFLYVALVDMLPDLMYSETLHTEPAVTFVLQNLGLLMGFTIMLMIALYEEQLMALDF